MTESTPKHTAEKKQSPSPNPEKSPQAQKEASCPHCHELEQKLKTLQSAFEEKDTKYKYLYAEFENFKKHMQKEKQHWIQFGWEALAHELVHVLDNLERALQYVSPKTQQNLVQGLQLVLKQLQEALSHHGLKPIETKNKLFDPHHHEAVAHEETDKHPEGSILREEVKGYLLHNRLLRPSKVVVAKTNKKPTPKPSSS